MENTVVSCKETVVYQPLIFWLTHQKWGYYHTANLELVITKNMVDTWTCEVRAILAPLSFIHSIGMCRMRWFCAILRSFFQSSLLYTLFFHLFPPTSLPSSLTSSRHLFLGLPLSLVASKFIYNTFLGILFSSILSVHAQTNVIYLTLLSHSRFFNHCINFFID